MKKKILITGCAGFIGTNFVKEIIPSFSENYNFVGIDALTYAGHKEYIQKEIDTELIEFHKIDIRSKTELSKIFNKHSFDGVIHFAAESHVDRSIKNPTIFFETNALGTLNLLNESIIQHENNADFKFVHISTDEVYGSLAENDSPFDEQHPLCPNSPYSASKAASDLLVRSFYHTYKLPTIITRCSNNYGPYQTPEKLIPLMIKKALLGENLPIYGDGKNIRDWIHVSDHVKGTWLAFTKGKKGEVYNLGGNCEIRNIDVAKSILQNLNKDESLINFVEDRKGHDWRYAINHKKASADLGWNPVVNFSQGLASTIEWFKENLNL